MDFSTRNAAVVLRPASVVSRSPTSPTCSSPRCTPITPCIPTRTAELLEQVVGAFVSNGEEALDGNAPDATA